MNVPLLFGGNSDGEIFAISSANLEDDGTAVCLRSVTATWAPVGWTVDALIRTASLMVSTNVGCTVLLTPILNGLLLDGTSGNPDSRVLFTIPVPEAGQRLETRNILGLSKPLQVGTSSIMKVGLRGTWFQFLVETVGALDASNGETNPDCRMEGLELDVEALLRSQQVVNHG